MGWQNLVLVVWREGDGLSAKTLANVDSWCGAGIVLEYPRGRRPSHAVVAWYGAAVESGWGFRFRLSDACGKAVGCGVEDYRGRFCMRHSRMVQPNRRLKSTLR